MFDNLFSKININSENVHVPELKSADVKGSSTVYDTEIDAAGGIDLQLLGIGNNGHIAFNEPSGVFPFNTHIVDLAGSTIEANKRFFKRIEDVPRQAVTMGVGSIMKAREIVLIATGAAKALAVKKMIKGDVDPIYSASALQFHHNVTVFLDKEYYFYLVRSGSISRRGDICKEMKKHNDCCDALFERFLFIRQHPEYHAVTHNHVWLTLYFLKPLLRNIVAFPQYFSKNCLKIRAKQLISIAVYRKDLISTKWQFYIFLMKIHPKCYQLVRWVYIRLISIYNKLTKSNKKTYRLFYEIV